MYNLKEIKLADVPKDEQKLFVDYLMTIDKLELYSFLIRMLDSAWDSKLNEEENKSHQRLLGSFYKNKRIAPYSEKFKKILEGLNDVKGGDFDKKLLELCKNDFSYLPVSLAYLEDTGYFDEVVYNKLKEMYYVQKTRKNKLLKLMEM